MKIGLIARSCNSGLGTLSWEFARHLRPEKVLLVENGVFRTFPERFYEFETRQVPAHHTITPELQDWILGDMDLLLSIETFYNWEIVKNAKAQGVKTALLTMFEMTPERLQVRPDMFLCPSKLDYQVFPEPKVYLPVPFDTERLIWRERKKAKVFIHTASHGGMNMRKGTPLLLEAMKYVKSDIELIIYSWLDFKSSDSRVKIKTVNFQNYWQLWREGDVLVYPQDYNGICLPVQEAFCSGLGVITTDIYPFNEYLPKDLLFQPKEFYDTRAASGLIKVKAAKIDPVAIAEKIDEIANKDISKYSRLGKEWAEKNSWNVLLPKYLEVFNVLCE